ncbi:MAG: hypothetical protein HN975_03695, partial [Anaerolineae bacterium]|nr:hypothetical protein [Anaerolineae bacterium]
MIDPNNSYQLECEIKDLDPSENLHDVTITYDNAKGGAYYMENLNAPDEKTDTFQLEVLENTEVTIDSIPDVEVGEIITLTGSGGKIVVQDSSGLSIPLNSGTLTVEDKSGNKNTFGVASTTNCSVNSATGKLEIVDSTAECKIFFKRKGSIEITATYEGKTDTYVGDSTDKTITSVKQSAITAAWEYHDGTNYVSGWPPD